MKYLLAFILLLFIGACKQGEQPASEATPTSSAQETDTRVLIRNTFAAMNPLAVPYSFNKEKAAIYKSKLDAEQDPFKRVNIQLQYDYELLLADRTELSGCQNGRRGHASAYAPLSRIASS